MILFTALTLLAVLLVLGIAIRVMLQNDYRVLSNLRGSTEAFYIAVAGLEWGKNEVAASSSFPPAPPDQARNFSAGAFSVSFASPAATGRLSATVVVRSAGTLGPSSHVLQARLMKAYDLADAAIGLRGNATPLRFGPSPILISGMDHDAATGTVLMQAPSRPALSAANEALRQRVLEALGDPPRAGVLESGADAPALSLSDYLPANLVTQLSSDLCSSAGVTVTTIPQAANLSAQDQTWGSPGAAEVRCYQGQSSAGDSLTLSGITGAGILIVKDADLVIAGALRWEGLIIVTGEQVGFKTTGASGKEVLGALLLNETGIHGSDSYLADIQGNLSLLFSRQALARAADLIPLATLTGLYGGLPSVISQQYWRALNP
jgi:hypothetical protein